MTILLFGSLNTFAHADLQEFDDQSLSNVAGQALFNMNYIPPNATGNVSNLGFYSLGLEGIMNINANINKLQLGCGGVNGAGNCDIDIDQVRLVGTAPGPSGTYVDSDAVMENPFIQFAVKNPNSASTRQVVGFAFGAQKVNGQLSIGQNPSPDIAGYSGGQKGLNIISGLIPVNVENVELSATLCTTTLGSTCLLQLGSGNLPLLNTDIKPRNGVSQPKGVFSSVVSGRRMTSLTLGPFALDAEPLNGFGGALVSALGGVAYGSLEEDFIDVHNLNINSTNNSGVLLTLNGQDILWPQIGASGISSFPTPSQYVNSDGSTVDPIALIAKRGWFLILPKTTIGGTATKPLVTANVLLGVLNIPSALQVLSLPGVTIPSINLKQIPVQNCYGSLKFC
ncbi:hypothetical protein [Acinetobacter defluvii]|uniref:hypothetical protein n=1 Tax=Acinetobacter defluvii TaxID=1871111 RepID=UPI003AF812CE